MKNIRLYLIVVSVFVAACSKEQEGHAHEEEVALSHTIWTDKTELFVEFRPLVVGKLTSFAAHFSDMTTFKPLTDGKLTVSLVSGGQGVRNMVEGPSQPGIFRPTIRPEKAGMYTLWFEVETGNYTDKVIIRNIEVYADEQSAIAANPHAPEDGNAISFLKEQAWKIDWAIAPVRRDSVFEIIRAGGEVLPSPGDERVVSATANGMVVFNAAGTGLGSPVNSGTLLFTLRSGGVVGNNMETAYRQARASYEKAQSEFERKEGLYREQAISKANYEEASLALELAKNTYQNLSGSYSSGGKQVKAGSKGFVKNILVSEGQYVQVGEPLAVIAQNRKLTLQADVPQGQFGKMRYIYTANFRMPHSAKTHAIEDFNGRLLSYGKSVSRDQPFVPVQFEIDNMADILPGSYVELFVKTRPRGTALVVPVGALMEDYGNYTVFVQTEGESFMKREITTGAHDGQKVEVLSGLEEGEMVVTKGAYQVKMASMSSSVPAHGHAH